MKDELLETLDIYGIPSQSLWRAFELVKLRELKMMAGFDSPVLEIGIGNGAFSSRIFKTIDDGIDINPRSVEVCRKRWGELYTQVHCMDARAMHFPVETYRTVFANCVIEHIPDLEGVLADCYRVLKQGGKFVTTVPLSAMDDYLLVKREWYASLRRRQLQHVNLLSSEEWVALFKSAGFSQVDTYPYLSGKDCHYWDKMDFPMCLGKGRYKVGTALHLMTSRLSPTTRHRLNQRLATRLVKTIQNQPNDSPCALAVIAIKG